MSKKSPSEFYLQQSIEDVYTQAERAAVSQKPASPAGTAETLIPDGLNAETWGLSGTSSEGSAPDSKPTRLNGAWLRVKDRMSKLAVEMAESAERTYGGDAPSVSGLITDNPHRELRHGREMAISHPLIRETIMTPIDSILLGLPSGRSLNKRHPYLPAFHQEYNDLRLNEPLFSVWTSTLGRVEVISRSHRKAVPNELFFLLGKYMLIAYPKLAEVRIEVAENLPERHLDGMVIKRNIIAQPVSHAPAKRHGLPPLPYRLGYSA